MDSDVYYVQCIGGHVFEAAPGSDLEARCIARSEEGKLDALCLHTSECPDCLEDERERHRRFASSCGDFGCPFQSVFDDEPSKCKDGCMAVKEFNETGESPYIGQLRGLPPGDPVHGVSVNGEPLYV